MKRVRLSRSEKEVLRLVASGVVECPPTYPLHRFNAALYSLEALGFIQSAREEGGKVIDLALTLKGRLYFAENPLLRNPIDWWRVATLIITILSLVVSIVALFISCTKLKI